MKWLWWLESQQFFDSLKSDDFWNIPMLIMTELTILDCQQVEYFISLTDLENGLKFFNIPLRWVDWFQLVIVSQFQNWNFFLIHLLCWFLKIFVCFSMTTLIMITLYTFNNSIFVLIYLICWFSQYLIASERLISSRKLETIRKFNMCLIILEFWLFQGFYCSWKTDFDIKSLKQFHDSRFLRNSTKFIEFFKNSYALIDLCDHEIFLQFQSQHFDEAT
jgi:hypothetical protein